MFPILRPYSHDEDHFVSSASKTKTTSSNLAQDYAILKSSYETLHFRYEHLKSLLVDMERTIEAGAKEIKVLKHALKPDYSSYKDSVDKNAEDTIIILKNEIQDLTEQLGVRERGNVLILKENIENEMSELEADLQQKGSSTKLSKQIPRKIRNITLSNRDPIAEIEALDESDPRESFENILRGLDLDVQVCPDDDQSFCNSSPSKSIVKRERDSLEAELLLQYSRFRELETLESAIVSISN